MALRDPRHEFSYPRIKQLDALTEAFPAVVRDNTATEAEIADIITAEVASVTTLRSTCITNTNTAIDAAGTTLSGLRTSAIDDSEDAIDAASSDVDTLVSAAVTDSNNAIDSAATGVDNLASIAITDSNTAIDATSLDTEDKTALKALIAGYINTIELNAASLKTTVGGYINTVELDAAGLKAAIGGYINTVTINTTTLKTTVGGYIGTIVVDESGLNTDIANVLPEDAGVAEFKTEMEAELEAAAAAQDPVTMVEICGECGGSGKIIAYYDLPGRGFGETDPEAEIPCHTCLGHGKTVGQYLKSYSTPPDSITKVS